MISVTLGKGNTLVAHLPGVNSAGHHVTIPLTVDGLRLLKSILQERHSPAKIGEPGAPTQQMVDAWLKTHAEEELARLRGIGVEAANLAKELGL